MNKLLIVTAPSGSGKTTIVRRLLERFPSLAFSVSATTRPPRPGEIAGRDYYFLSPDRFRELIRQQAFVEWEEVYADRYYGTLKSEVEKRWQQGKDVVFDIDTRGAINLKKQFPEQSLALFIRPPSLEELTRRLKARQTESEAEVQVRLDKAEEELRFEDRFDHVIVNDQLPEAVRRAEELVSAFLDLE